MKSHPIKVLLSFLFIFLMIPDLVQAEVNIQVNEQVQVIVEGKTNEVKQTVTILVENENRKVYIDQSQTDRDGHYSFQFQVDSNQSFTGKVNVNGTIEEFTFDTIGKEEDTKNPINVEEQTISLEIEGLDGEELFEEDDIEISDGDTPYSVLVEAIGRSEVEASGSGDNIYVTSIFGLEEFEHGPESGWIFFVNGRDPDISAGAYELEDGDDVEWRYTTNLGEDVGATRGEKPVAELQEEELTKYIDQDILESFSRQSTAVILHQGDWMNPEEIEKLTKKLENNDVLLEETVEPDESTLIEDEKGEVELVLPSKSVDKEIEISIKEQSNEGHIEVVTSIYEMGPSGIHFDKSVYLTLQVPLKQEIVDDLTLAWFNEETGTWESLPTVIDVKSSTITAKVDHFTKFAVIDQSKLQKKVEQENITNVIDQAVSFIKQKEYYSEWDLFALARYGVTIPSTLDKLKKRLNENGGTFRKVTDYERFALAVKAAGGDPTNIAGYNLIERIYNNDKMTMQGINGPIFALIVLNMDDYHIPQHAKWTKPKLIDHILEYQNADGAFALVKGDSSNVDLTAMALAALQPYKDQPAVSQAINQAVKWLSKQQLKNGGFELEGKENSESAAQVMIALTALGIDPRGDLFTKEKGDLVDYLLSFQQENGGFSNLKGGESDSIATEQAMIALVAYQKYLKGEGSIYSFTQNNNKYSDDEQISPYAIKSVYKARDMGIMIGFEENGQTLFKPKQQLTRAQFAKVILKTLGVKVNNSYQQQFSDVSPDAWYYDDVMAAKDLGIIQGVSPDTFLPNDKITREQMALMLGRAYELNAKTNHVEALYKDYDQVLPEAHAYLAGLYEKKIMLGYQDRFHPHEPVTREMAAVVVVRLIEKEVAKK